MFTYYSQNYAGIIGAGLSFEDERTGQCCVSNGGIGVPEPKDHYSNPLTLFLLYHLLDFALDLIHPCSQSCSSL